MSKKPKTILFDLEIIPDVVEAVKNWTSLSTNFSGQTLKASVTSICCFGWKELEKGKAQCLNVWDDPKKLINDDRDLCIKAYDILKDADCIITHNGKRFDLKFLQTRLLIHGLPPLPKIPHIDTCAEAKRSFFVINNRLNTLAKLLTDTQKIEHEGWELWVKTWQGDKKARAMMTKYCKGDVLALEAVFLKMLPFTNGLPNFNLFREDGFRKGCPKCGSFKLHSRGTEITKTKRYTRYQCQDCGGWSRSDAADKLVR